METTFEYLRQFGPALAERILETYPPLQSIRDPIAPALAGLLRKPFPHAVQMRLDSVYARVVVPAHFALLVLPVRDCHPVPDCVKTDVSDSLQRNLRMNTQLRLFSWPASIEDLLRKHD